MGFADAKGGAPSNDDEPDPAQPSAFAYAVYANPPDRLVALATENGWKAQQAKKPRPQKGHSRNPAVSAVTHGQQEGTPMTTEPKKAEITNADLDNAKAEAAKAATARIKTIMTSDAANGRGAMAQKLAYDKPGITAEEAIELLEMAPKEAEASAESDQDDDLSPGAQARRRAAAALAQPGGKQNANANPRAAWADTISRANASVRNGVHN